MNQPNPFQPPTLTPPAPVQQTLFPPAAAALMLPDMQAALPGLVQQRCLHKQQPIAGDATYMEQAVAFVLQSAPVQVPPGESRVRAVYQWLNALTAPYELDAETRARLTPVAAPSNISDRTAPQVATLPVAAIPQPPQVPQNETKETKGGAYLDPLDGTSYATLRGLKSHVTRAHKTDWPVFCQTHGLDPETGLKPGTQPAAPVSEHPTAPPPPSPTIPPMLGAAAPVVTPTFQVTASSATPAVMPSPVTSHAPPLVTFQVPQLGGIAPPQAPAPQQLTVQAQAPALQQLAAQQVMVHPPVPTAPAAHVAPGLDRYQLAQMLGGPVDLLIVKLTDVAAVNLTGRIDVNQLALVAEQQARQEMRIIDLAQGSYGAGKQAGQRHFAELLTKYPNVFLLLNGYEPILPAGYLEIITARACKAYTVGDQGRQITDLKLG